jgi:site-specific DNA-methyltransferase (adenine-specific)
MSARTGPRNTILVGDVRDRLRALPAGSVDTVITSPPYLQLRNYAMAAQIGLEDDVTAWVEALRDVGRELARVLKPTGAWWLNLGDSYSRDLRTGAPPKSLLLGPERLALALVADGWTIRNKVIWAKPNPMPASVRDRLACTWEVVYFLVRSPRYNFDLDAIRLPHRTRTTNRSTSKPSSASSLVVSARPPSWAGPLAGNNSGLARYKANGVPGHPLGKNPGDVWTIATANFRGEHFAVFPTALVEPPLMATCPERVCANCGIPWERARASTLGRLAVRGELRPACACRAGTRPGLVLDPFFGSGTVGVVAERHGRDWLGIELNPAFATLATDRIADARGQADPTAQRRAA